MSTSMPGVGLHVHVYDCVLIRIHIHVHFHFHWYFTFIKIFMFILTFMVILIFMLIQVFTFILIFTFIFMFIFMFMFMFMHFQIYVAVRYNRRSAEYVTIHGNTDGPQIMPTRPDKPGSIVAKSLRPVLYSSCDNVSLKFKTSLAVQLFRFF